MVIMEMMKTSKKKLLVTHNGSFHADDLFAAATLSLWLGKHGKNFEIIRSRDLKTIENADYVFDVGGKYDPKKNRFDHHQQKGAGKRKNGIPYSSFGLVWKHFGLDLCGGDKEAWRTIDEKIASPIDAVDNGVDIVIPKFKNIMPYDGDRPFLAFAPTWQERKVSTDTVFKNEVKNVIKVLEREIKVARIDSLGKETIEKAYKKAKNKKIIELPKSFPRYLYQNTLAKHKEPIYVIYKSEFAKTWKVEAIKKSPETMQSRKPFPKSWRGLLNDDPKLKKLTGIPDVTFCHKGGFLATTKSRNGAIKLAKLALK